MNCRLISCAVNSYPILFPQITKGDWVCRSCSGKSNSISFIDYSKGINGQQQDVLQFLNLKYKSYREFVEENAEAIAFSHSSSSFNANVHTAVDRNLFSIGSILFVRSPDRHDFRLPCLPASEEEYVSINVIHLYVPSISCFALNKNICLHYNDRHP